MFNSRVMTGRSNEAEIKPKINCARKKKSDGLSDRVDFFATTVQKKKEARIQVSTRDPWNGSDCPTWIIRCYFWSWSSRDWNLFSRSSKIWRQVIVVVDLFRQPSHVIIKLLTPNHITRPYTTSKIYCVNSSIIFKERNQNYFANSAILISTQILAKKWLKRSKSLPKS